MTEAPKNLAQSLRHTYVEAPQPVQAKARATQPKERSPVKEDIRQEGGEQQPQTPAKVALMHTIQTPAKIAGSPEEASAQPTTAKKFVRPEIENRVFPVPGVEVMEPQEFKTLWDRMLARRSNYYNYIDPFPAGIEIEACFKGLEVIGETRSGRF